MELTEGTNASFLAPNVLTAALVNGAPQPNVCEDVNEIIAAAAAEIFPDDEVMGASTVTYDTDAATPAEKRAAGDVTPEALCLGDCVRVFRSRLGVWCNGRVVAVYQSAFEDMGKTLPAGTVDIEFLDGRCRFESPPFHGKVRLVTFAPSAAADMSVDGP